MTPYAHITEDALIDRGAILTREDARIRARMSWVFRHHYEYGDRKDAALMALADVKANLRREIKRICNDPPTGELQ
jgi:hypothetical protein